MQRVGKQVKMKRLGILTGVAMAAAVACAGELERVPYNRPGATSDLGVGLWAWPLPMDFDGDGDLDLVVSCPDKPYNGVYFFENPTGRTSPRKWLLGLDEGSKMPVFKPGRKIGGGRGLGNVQVSLRDGKPCVLSPGTAYPDFRVSGFEKGVALPGVKPNVHTNAVRGNVWRHADYDGDGALDLVIGVGDWKPYGWHNAYDAAGNWTNDPIHGLVYWVRNAGTTAQPMYAEPALVMAGDKPVRVYGNPMPACSDFDGDGDLDLICGEFLDGFTYFENTGTRTRPRYAPGRRLKTPAGADLRMDLQMITPSAVDWDGDGDTDLICGDEDGRVAFIENAGKADALRAPLFSAPRYFRQEAADLKFGALAAPFGCDWDGDGDWDLICGNTAGYIAFIENLSGRGVARPSWAEPRRLEAGGKTLRIMAGPNGSIQGPCEAKWGYTTQTVADWDGDGLLDIVANSIWGKVVWFRNEGARGAPKLAAAQPVEVEWNGPQPTLAWGWMRPEGKALLTQWRTTPVATDWNEDGLVDLVMLDHEGFLVLFERALRGGRRVLLHPRRCLLEVSGKPLWFGRGKAGGSGRRKICLADWDGDGKRDILINAINAEFWRQTAAENGTWTFRNMGHTDKTVLAGHDTCPTVVDFDDNNIPDLVVGAEDGYFYFLSNPRASRAK